LNLRDWRNAQHLRRIIFFESCKVETPDEIRNGVRFMNLSVSQLPELLLLDFGTMTPWIDFAI